MQTDRLQTCLYILKTRRSSN